MEYQFESSIAQQSAATFDPFADPVRSVEVVHGPYSGYVQPNLSVAQVRAGLATRLNLPPEVQAVVDGELVGDETVLRDGQRLHFVREAGEKG